VPIVPVPVPLVVPVPLPVVPVPVPLVVPVVAVPVVAVPVPLPVVPVPVPLPELAPVPLPPLAPPLPEPPLPEPPLWAETEGGKDTEAKLMAKTVAKTALDKSKGFMLRFLLCSRFLWLIDFQNPYCLLNPLLN
jgi:signal-induced proliferation-associated 1 like protein 3